jgi:hypothetical protein
MKKVTITRNRIVELKQYFSDVSEITPATGGAVEIVCPHCSQIAKIDFPLESCGHVQTFKWRAERNADKCKQIAHSFVADLNTIMAETPASQTFSRLPAMWLATGSLMAATIS